MSWLATLKVDLNSALQRLRTHFHRHDKETILRNLVEKKEHKLQKLQPLLDDFKKLDIEISKAANDKNITSTQCFYFKLKIDHSYAKIHKKLDRIKSIQKKIENLSNTIETPLKDNDTHHTESKIELSPTQLKDIETHYASQNWEYKRRR